LRRRGWGWFLSPLLEKEGLGVVIYKNFNIFNELHVLEPSKKLLNKISA
jgi:hypothetical protein